MSSMVTMVLRIMMTSDENNIDSTRCCAAYYNYRDVWVPSPMLVCGGCDDLEENDGGGLTLSESGRSNDNDGDNGWAPNNVIVEGRSRVVRATNEDNVDRICPYPHNRAYDKGGDDDGHDKMMAVAVAALQRLREGGERGHHRLWLGWTSRCTRTMGGETSRGCACTGAATI